MGKCHITSVTQSQSHKSCHMTLHDGSHDRHRKVVHRPYSSCISSIENLTGTLLSSLCQSLNKEQLALFWLGVQLSYIQSSTSVLLLSVCFFIFLYAFSSTTFVSSYISFIFLMNLFASSYFLFFLPSNPILESCP